MASPKLKLKKKTTEKHLKLMLWGAAGSGKTITSLQFPDPLLIDSEGGANFYEDRYKFHTVEATTTAELKGIGEYLLEQKHSYKTVIIDSLTDFWKECVQEVMRQKYQNPQKTPMQQDWKDIKPAWFNALKPFKSLKINVVATSKATTDMKAKKNNGEFPPKPQCGSPDYIFDAIVHCINFAGYPYIKNRPGLPKEFKLSYAEFKKVLSPVEEKPKAKHKDPA